MIILGVMVLVILFAAYELFFAKGKKPVAIDPGKNITELNTFISEMTLAIGKDTPSPVDAYMIKRAEAGWARDPFYERKNLSGLGRYEGAGAGSGCPDPETPVQLHGVCRAGQQTNCHH